MLLTNSLPLMWLYYIILSLIVLVAGYFAIGFLQRVLRWTIVGLVAGAIWIPWIVQIAATHDSPAYTGVAPAIIDVSMDVLAHRFGASFIVLIVGAVVGAIIGATLAVRSKKSKPQQKGKGGKGNKKDANKTTSLRKDPKEPTL